MSARYRSFRMAICLEYFVAGTFEGTSSYSLRLLLSANLLRDPNLAWIGLAGRFALLSFRENPYSWLHALSRRGHYPLGFLRITFIPGEHNACESALQPRPGHHRTHQLALRLFRVLWHPGQSDSSGTYGVRLSSSADVFRIRS